MRNTWERIHWKKIRDVCLLAGAITLAIGVIFMTLGLITDNDDLVRDSTFFIYLGVALISLSIASHSVVIANQSDEKMTANANESFLKIVDVFEDKRIQLLQHRDWLGIEATIWKCKTYVDRAINLKESARISVENQNKLFDQFDYLINRTGLPWGTEEIRQKDVDNIHKLERNFLKLDLTDDSKTKLTRIKAYVKKFERKNV